MRNDLFSPSNFLLSLSAPNGPVVKLTEKVYAPVKEYPKVWILIFHFNFTVYTMLSFIKVYDI